MNTNCVVHFDTRTLVVSRSFLKKASVPFSNEYHMMKSLTEAHPNFCIEIRHTYSPNYPRKPFMPTYDNMLDFIHRQINAEELLEEFESARQIGKMHRNAYMHVRRWFLMRFPEMGQAA